MSTVHFLNVKNGDCSWIQHNSGHITVIDVNNAKIEKPITESHYELAKSSIRGNFNQKNYPVNPINYMKAFGVSTIMRFILTHPDMDHMGGIKDFFSSFDVLNFWDTDNTKEIEKFEGPYNEEDWLFYKKLRSGAVEGIKRLTLYAGSRGKYYNQSDDGSEGGDGLYIIAPTEELVQQANNCGDFNDCSYVILYLTGNHKKILFAGDSHDKTWEYILDNHKNAVENVDILIAPHHGRKSGRSFEFLDVVKPKITFFGNAESEHLAYDAWRYRGLEYITNNQANCIVADINNNDIDIYVTYENFARTYNPLTYYSESHRAWYLKRL
jgi:competence protein ComEC